MGRWRALVHLPNLPGSRFVDEVFHSGSKGLLLWKRDLLKTVRRTRSGIISLLLPMVLSAVVAISFSGAQTGESDQLAALVLMNMWFVAVDFGVYPVRLIKRLRAVFLAYEIPLLAMFMASCIYAAVNFVIRCGVVIMLMPNSDGLSPTTAFLIGVMTGVISFACFSLGSLLASISLSIHEVFIYAPHLFYGLGVLSGFIQIPALSTRLPGLSGSPIGILAEDTRTFIISGSANSEQEFRALMAIGLISLVSTTLLAWSRRLARAVTLL